MTSIKASVVHLVSPENVELHEKIARYRTALVILIDMIRREQGYMSPEDQRILKHVQRILDEDRP